MENTWEHDDFFLWGAMGSLFSDKPQMLNVEHDPTSLAIICFNVASRTLST